MMNHQSSPFGRLQTFARSLGGDVILVSFSELQTKSLDLDVSYAPFNGCLAIDWFTKKVYVARERHRRPDVVGGLIHEMGHVFGCEEPPRGSLEFDFAGWENQVSKVCGARRQWLHQMKNYVIHHKDIRGSWEDFGWHERNGWLRAAIERGKKIGNLTKDGLPVSVR